MRSEPTPLIHLSRLQLYSRASDQNPVYDEYVFHAFLYINLCSRAVFTSPPKGLGLQGHGNDRESHELKRNAEASPLSDV